MQSIAHYHQAFVSYYQAHLFKQEPENLYVPVDYILSLGGKRLRPLLVLMGADLFDGAVEKALPAAMAVEVFHNFTLLHDDIMDAAPLRRGQPTVHTKFGINTGILSGDVMLIKAYQFLMRAAPDNPALTVRLLDIFNKMAVEVCEGQQFDMDFETRSEVAIPEYIRMIELKTSVLIAAAFQMGALLGGATEGVAAHLYEFGRCIGIAFQIQDDILDTFGDPEKFGKKVGGDIVQNKKTLLVLKTLEKADASQKQTLEVLMSEKTTDEAAKIEAVKALFNALGIRQAAEADMNDYLNLAFEHLRAAGLSAEKEQYMTAWSLELMQREV